MDTFQTIIAIISGVLGILATAIPLTITSLKQFKNATNEKKLRMLAEFAKTAVEFVEKLHAKDGGQLESDTKLKIALTEIKALCMNNNVEFDEAEASTLIENLINFSKAVNPRKGILSQQLTNQQ